MEDGGGHHDSARSQVYNMCLRDRILEILLYIKQVAEERVPVIGSYVFTA